MTDKQSGRLARRQSYPPAMPAELGTDDNGQREARVSSLCARCANNARPCAYWAGACRSTLCMRQSTRHAVVDAVVANCGRVAGASLDQARAPPPRTTDAKSRSGQIFCPAYVSSGRTSTRDPNTTALRQAGRSRAHAQRTTHAPARPAPCLGFGLRLLVARCCSAAKAVHQKRSILVPAPSHQSGSV